MSVELKVFGGAYLPKDKALKKSPELKPLAISVIALSKSIAEAVIYGKLAASFPEHIDDYFKVKIWEHREDLPCPDADIFSPEFFESVAVWNAEAGEPSAIQQDAEEDAEALTELKVVATLDKSSRTAALVLFGPVAEVTAAQYGQMIDLINDDDGGFNRELAEAISRESRVLALAPGRQEQLLVWVRETAKESAQWTDIVKLLTKWLDTPADKRPQATSTNNETHTDTGATLGGGNPTDRSSDLVHNLATLKIEVAVAILSLFDEIDIYWIPQKLLSSAKGMAEAEQDTRFTAWWKQLRRTPGILDYSRAAIIALIKGAPEDLWLDPVALREHINRELVESDHAHPDQKTIDIACKPKPRNLPENPDAETQQIHANKADLPTTCPARDAELDKELEDAFSAAHDDEEISRQLAAERGEFVPGISDPADPKWVDGSAQPKIENLGGGVFSVDSLIPPAASNEVEKEEVRPALNQREIDIAHALNDLISGHTGVMSKEEAEGVVTCTGHLIADVLPLLIVDITTTEFCLSPDFTDEEIHDVATTILYGWSGDAAVRQKIALDAIVECRRPAPPKAVVLDPPAVTVKPKKAAAPEVSVQQLTYRQQLTIAALQGLCANPAWRGEYEDLPLMAVELAGGVISQEEQNG